MSFIDRLKSSLSRTSAALSGKLEEIFLKKKLDTETLEQLEETLLQADIDHRTVKLILNQLSQNNKFLKEVSLQDIKQVLADIIASLFIQDNSINFETNNTPLAIIFFGANGNGKTTTIAKLANHLKVEHHKKILLAACDTYRAAATEQLEFWANKLDIAIVKAEHENQDPASVAYKAAEQAVKQNYDILLIDTSGRLPNKQNLLLELEKIIRSVSKHQLNCCNLMILDGTTGQNALMQVEHFNKIMKIDGWNKARSMISREIL